MAENAKVLTTVALTSMKSGEVLVDIKENRGLRVLCGTSGVKTFFYRFRSPESGKIKQIKIGRFQESKLRAIEGQVGLAQARINFLELKALRDSGICPVAEKQRQKHVALQLKDEEKREQLVQAFTLESLCENYLTNCIDGVRSKKAASEARRTIYGDPVRELGSLPAIEITSKQILDMILKVVERGANVQAGFMLRELTAAFDHALDVNLPETHVNPCYQAKGKLKRKRIRLTSKQGTRVLSDVEINRFLSWLPTSKFTEGQKGVLQLTLLTGCRTGEACVLRWKDLDLQSGVWNLQETKTEVPRNIQLSKQAIYLLNSIVSMSSEFVFVQKTGNPVEQKTLTQQLWVMRTKGGFLDIPHWSPHDIRRSVRTGLARIGCPSEVAEAILGHSAKGIIGVYNLHRYERECASWLQVWCNHLDSVIGKISKEVRNNAD